MSGVKSLRCLVVVVVVVVGLLAAEGDAHENIKMCGRDLIRHAVSYCGHSRLKRAILMMEGPNHREPTSPGQEEGRDESSGPAPVPSQPEGEEREDVVSLMSRWLPLSARERRTAQKISDLCCEKGCSKKELIQFC